MIRQRQMQPKITAILNCSQQRTEVAPQRAYRHAAYGGKSAGFRKRQDCFAYALGEGEIIGAEDDRSQERKRSGRSAKELKLGVAPAGNISWLR